MSDMSSENLKTDGVDQAIKSAAKKAWCSECAPEALRCCVMDMFRCTETPSHRGSQRRWMLWPLAAAAMIALVIGIKYTVLASTHSHASPILATLPPLPALPASLQADLVKTHEHCCHAADHHHLKAPKNDDVAIAQAMRGLLSQAVLVARPTDGGWDFRGAAICPVGTTRAGHLVFAKDNESISVFSLPMAVAPNVTNGEQFETTIDGHAIAAFTKDGGLFCLVSSGNSQSITLKDLTQMRDQMEDHVTTASARPAVNTNLLYQVASR
jgi:hypothetical protein